MIDFDVWFLYVDLVVFWMVDFWIIDFEFFGEYVDGDEVVVN